MQVVACAGGVALWVSGLLSAWTGAADTIAFFLAGAALLAATRSEVSRLQRAWGMVAIGLPLLVLEVGANPMLTGTSAALAALVQAALGAALSLRARTPDARDSRDVLALAVVGAATWMMAPGAGALAAPTAQVAPESYLAPTMLPGLLLGVLGLLPRVARRWAKSFFVAPALWCAALPFRQAIDRSLPRAPVSLMTAHALASFTTVTVTSLALSFVVEGHREAR